MLYIIIVNYNSIKLTKKCIDSIFKSSYKKFKVVLVDNNSTDNSVEYINNKYIKESNFKVKFISNHINKGFASGINIGIKFALSNLDCDYLLTLNNDTLLKSDCIEQLISNYSINTIVSPSIYDYDNKNKVQSLGGSVNKYTLSTKHLKKMNKNSIDYLPGSALFFDKGIIDTIGLFPEEYFMYYEDVDWSKSAILHNIALIVNEKAIIYHKKNIEISFYTKMRSGYNRILYCKKYFKFKLPFIVVISIISIFKSIFIYQMRKK